MYLDYTGGGLHADSQVRLHADLLARNVFGNPHSASPSSTAMTDAVERARDKVLDYFNGTGEYTAVFTLNASGALKLVGESYPFEPGGRLLLTVDNHNSVNGIREFARARGAEVDYTPLTVPELRIETTALLSHLDQADRARAEPVRLPCPVELLRRQASARAHRHRTRTRMGCAGGCGGIRADQPSRFGARFA